MATTAVLNGTAIYNSPPYAFRATDQVDWGSADLAATLLTGDLRPEEWDQYLAEIRYVRGVTIPMVISGGTAAAAVANTLALAQLFTGATRTSPVNFVFTPNGGNPSTFKVIGGAIEAPWDTYQENAGYVTQAVLHLQCLPFAYGTAQNLGSSGAPLITNQPSPAAVTLTPSPTGDAPADVTLFVKNRSASAIRSMRISAVSGNTTWVANSLASTWTDLGPGGVVSGLYTVTTSDSSTIQTAASFTTPALPADRRFRILLRADEQLAAGTAPASFRIRVLTGSTEVVGEWQTPPNLNLGNLPTSVSDMGGFMIPVSEVGSLGAGSTTTTVIVEARGNDSNAVVVRFYEALFAPDDSSVLVETSDTAKTLAAAAATIQLESDQVYDSSGNPAGGVLKGSALRILGSSRAYVYTSQQYEGTMSGSYAPENVDAWATATPRYIHLA